MVEWFIMIHGGNMDFVTRKKENLRLYKLIAKHTTARNALLDSCTHDETVLKHSYTPGGYLDTGYDEWWDQCTLCGKRFNIRTRSDGLYG